MGGDAMLNDNYGLDATIQLSEDKNDNGEPLVLIVFKPKPEIEEDKNFEKNSYLSLGETENVVFSHVVNFSANKTIFKEDDKTTYVVIFNTHMYVEKEDVKHCFEVYARAMKNIDKWIKIPGHDATDEKFRLALTA